MNRIKTKRLKSWKGLSKKKKIITSVVAVVLVCSVTGSLIFIKTGKAGQSAKMTVQSATVTKGSISNTIVGTGTLEEDDSNSITVPSGITIKGVSVESGDQVSKGDTLATVDKTSVLEAIETVQEQIEELDEKINDCKDSEEKTTVKAKVSGTVKKVYAKKGDDVTDCISENGALIVIAIDGDNTQTIDVTASGGTVSKVYVSKGDTVEEGDKLIVIKNDSHSVQYKKYMAQRKALASSLKKLLTISKTGTIIADSDGTIGDVNISEGTTSSGSNTSSSNSSGTSNSATASKMSYSTDSNETNNTSSVGTSNRSGIASVVTLSTASKSGSANNAATESTTNGTNAESSTKISFEIASSGKTTSDRLVVETPKTGNTPQTKIENADNSYTGTIKWNADSNTFDSETTYSAEIVLTAQEGFVFGADSITKIEKGLVSGITLSDDCKTLSFKITFPETEAVNKSQSSETTNTSEKTTSGNSENNTKNSTVNNSSSSNNVAQNNSNNTGSANGNSGNINSNTANLDSTHSNSEGLSSGTVSTSTATLKSSATDSSSSSDDNTDYDSYSNEVTAFTMSTDETMLMSVSVDELDINSVEKDQEAQITLDAIENKTFTGKVTKVGNSATSSNSGVSKYTVKISIPKDEQMKIGMNASATIVIESKEDILTVPINALQEKGNETYVYTEKDSDGNLSGEKEITTGLSDGDNVEVTEGLSEGDIIYYNKTGNTSSGGRASGDSNKGPGGMPDSNGGSDMKSGGRGGDFSGGYGGTPGQKPNQ